MNKEEFIKKFKVGNIYRGTSGVVHEPIFEVIKRTPKTVTLLELPSVVGSLPEEKEETHRIFVTVAYPSYGEVMSEYVVRDNNHSHFKKETMSVFAENDVTEEKQNYSEDRKRLRGYDIRVNMKKQRSPTKKCPVKVDFTRMI